MGGIGLEAGGASDADRIHEMWIPQYEGLELRARRAGRLLVAVTVLAWLAAGIGLADVLLVERRLQGERIATEDWSAHQLAAWLAFGVQALVFVFAAVGFLDWLYQARINVRAFGARRLRFTRGWTLAAFFVPIVNLWRPLQVISEVWRASDPRVCDPFAWKSARGSLLLWLWWLAFVGFLLCEGLGVVLLLTSSQSLTKIGIAQTVATAADVLLAVSASLGYFVVVHLSERQARKRAALGEQADGEPAEGVLLATAE